jgi:hypothetical protein
MGHSGKHVDLVRELSTGHEDRQANDAIGQTTSATLDAPLQFDVKSQLAVSRPDDLSDECLHMLNPLRHQVAIVVEPPQHFRNSGFRPRLRAMASIWYSSHGSERPAESAGRC